MADTKSYARANRVDHENQEKDHFYETPAWAVEALLKVERFSGLIWEPACGRGAISKVLEAHGLQVMSSDLVNRGYGTPAIDFLMEYKQRAASIITNPPYKLAEDFARRAIAQADHKVAFLVRLAWLEGQERRKLFEQFPPARVWVFSKRVTMWKDGDVQEDKTGSVAYCWMVWENPHTSRTILGWI